MECKRCFFLSAVCLLLLGCAAPATERKYTPTPDSAVDVTEAAAQPPTVTATAVPPTITNTPTSTPVPTETLDMSFLHTPTPEATPRPFATIDPALPPPTGQIFMLWDSDPVRDEHNDYFDYELYHLAWPISPTFQIVDMTSIQPARVSFIRENHVSSNQQKLALPILIDTNGNGRIDGPGYETDKPVIHIYDTLDGSFTRLDPDNYSGRSPEWLPNGEEILYLQNEKIVSMNLTDSSSETILQIPDSQIGRLLLSPDGQLLVTSARSGQIAVYNYATKQKVASPSTDEIHDLLSPVWSPDSQWLSFTHLSSPASLTVYSRQTNQFISWPAERHDRFGASSWSPDSQRLAFSHNRTTLTVWNPETLSTMDVLSATYVSAPLWSSNNQLAAGVIDDEESQIVVVDMDTGEQQTWALNHAYRVEKIKLLSWSPDGNWLAFIVAGESNLQTGVYLLYPGKSEVHYFFDPIHYHALSNLIWLSSYGDDYGPAGDW